MADKASMENGKVNTINHGDGAWFSIVCNHGMDDSAQLLVSDTSWIRHRSCRWRIADPRLSAMSLEVGRCTADSSRQLQSMDVGAAHVGLKLGGAPTCGGLVGEEDLCWVRDGLWVGFD
jgi:hypothetical protein